MPRGEPQECAGTAFTSKDVAAGVEFDVPLTAVAGHRTGKAAELDQERPIANMAGAEDVVVVAIDEQALVRRAAIEIH